MSTTGILIGLTLAQLSQGRLAAPPSQMLHFPDAKILRVRPMFIVAADDDGGHRHTSVYGRTGKDESPADVALFVRDINRAFECAGIRMEFDPKTDYEVRHRTALNRNFPSELNGADLDIPESAMTDRRKIPSRWDPGYTAVKLKLVEEFPDRIVILLQDGSAWNWDAKRGRWAASTQSMGLQRDGMITASQVTAPLLIHELGHFFGLAHTFGGVSANSLENVLKAIAEESKKGKPIEEAIRIFDGDGLADTPEDPGRPLLESLGYKPFQSRFGWEVNIAGPDGEMSGWKIKPDVFNWMSYYPEANFPHPATGKVEGRFSRGQCARMREYATSKLASKLIGRQET